MVTITKNIITKKSIMIPNGIESIGCLEVSAILDTIKVDTPIRIAVIENSSIIEKVCFFIAFFKISGSDFVLFFIFLIKMISNDIKDFKLMPLLKMRGVFVW
ncbi:hypothetical protein A9255_18530 [Xenorhabdus hominickii]|uniref:Uncharacterized protein n=1 Tax=Xenorhabdus hominickii TaxID=351679 RepID=A0ABM6DWK7_XENHO|nr:hypothetical protein A9255_18530 [Xenorhabdus hominickii]